MSDKIEEAYSEFIIWRKEAIYTGEVAIAKESFTAGWNARDAVQPEAAQVERVAGAFKIIDGLILDGVISVGRGAELMEMGLLDFREYARTHAVRMEEKEDGE